MTARPDLLPIAERELQLREKRPDWPSDDIAAWRAVVALVEHGIIETELTWPQILTPLQEAEQRRIEAVIAAKSTDKEASEPEAGVPRSKLAHMEQRLGGVVAIRRVIERSAWRVGQCLGAGA